jgi:DNA-binding response OmpR family regulator
MVVEDDDKIGRLLESGLRAGGHEVLRQRTGRGAIAEAGGQPLDLILLDLGLPDLDGIAVCRELRLLQPATVIVMLTARRNEMDVVAGLESGADDYLTKPFRLVELQARIRAHLRRNTPSGIVEGDEPLHVGDLTIEPAARRVFVGDAEVPLRSKEFELLFRLARDAGTALRRETLMADVWDENWFGSTKTLDVHVAAVRRKLEAAAAVSGRSVPTITTLRGHGYRLERP